MLASSHAEARHPCLFPRRPAARVTFLSGKVTKAIGAGHDGFSDVVSLKLPCASRWARAGANSHIPVLGHRAFPARPAAMLGAMRRRLKLTSTRPSMACSVASHADDAPRAAASGFLLR